MKTADGAQGWRVRRGKVWADRQANAFALSLLSKEEGR